MKPLHLTLGLAAGAALVVLAWAPALAQKAGRTEAKVPDSWSYEIKNGRRVPKGTRVQAADGSWREELKSSNCQTVREQTAAGEYREVRKCD